MFPGRDRSRGIKVLNLIMASCSELSCGVLLKLSPLVIIAVVIPRQFVSDGDGISLDLETHKA